MSLKMYHQKKTIQHIIAVAAGKGGVGKSTVAVNLALALNEKKYRVGLFDADIYGPSLRRMLPEDRLPSQKGEKIIPALSHGIRYISMAFFRKANEAAAVRAPIANNVISQFLKNVEWGELDYLIIDFPPGTGDIQLTLCQQANLSGAVMVTTPQEVALMDVRKAMHLFDQVHIPVLGIVENMSYYHPQGSSSPQYLFGRGGGERLARECGAPFLGAIPVDPLVSECGDKGTSLFQSPSTEHSALSAFRTLSEKVIDNLNIIEQQENDGVGSFEITWKEMP